MINTELHNSLVEKEIQNKLIESDRINQKAKTELMKEKLKSVLLISAVIFIILLMLTFLYWIFPNKQSHNISTLQIEKLLKQYSKECDCNDEFKQQVKSPEIKKSRKKGDEDKGNGDSSKELKNGTDYVKHDNHVYKRTWKNGVLVEDIQLEKTIEESRKKAQEKIPQLATPNTGKRKNI